MSDIDPLGEPGPLLAEIPVPAPPPEPASAPPPDVTNEYDTLIAQAPLEITVTPKAGANEYDGLVVDFGRERSQRLRATVLGAQKSTPDAAAKSLALSRKTGLPTDLVERNLPKVEGEQKLNEYDSLLSKSPKLADWLTADPVNAKVAGSEGDFSKLSLIEEGVNELNRGLLGQQANAGFAGWKVASKKLSELEGALGRQSRGEYLTPFDKAMIAQESVIRETMKDAIIEYGGQFYARQGEAAELPLRPVVKEMQEAGKAGDWGGVFEALKKDPLGAIYSISLQSAAMLPWQIGGYMAAGPVGAFGVSFLMEYMGGVTDAMEQAGVNMQDPTQVTKAFANPELMAKVEQQAAIKAGTIAAFDTASLKLASLPMGVGKSAVVKGGTNIVAQVGVQGAAGAAGEAAGSTLAGMKVDPFAVVAEALGEMGSAPVEVATTRWTEMVRRDATREEFEKFKALPPLEQLALGNAIMVDRLIEQATNTKIAALSPEKLQEFIGSISAAAQTIFVPAEIVATFMQDMTSVQAEAFAERLGISEQLTRIARTGEDVAIPLAMYVTGAGEAHAAWREQIRTEVDGFSVKQAQEWEKAKAVELKAMQDRFDEQIAAGVVDDPRTVVYQQVLAMAKANGYTNDVAAQHAALYAARYHARAERNPGRYADALDAFQKAGTGKGMTIRTELAGVTRALGPDQLDVMLNSIRSGRDPATIKTKSGNAVPVSFKPNPGILTVARRLSKGWGPEKHIPEPQSLTEFVRSRGGLNIASSEAGDLRAGDLAKLPGLLRQKKGEAGQSADIVAQAAKDAGFVFGDETQYGSGVDVNAFISALIADASNRTKNYRDDADTQAWMAQQDYFAQNDRWLKEGVEWDPKGREPIEIAWFLSQDPGAQRLMALSEREILGPDSSQEVAYLTDAERAKAASQPPSTDPGDIFRTRRQQLADVLASMGLDPSKMTNEQIRAAIDKEIEGQTFDQSADKRELVAVHNLSAKNLARAQKIGGIAAPSVAIIKGENPFDGFGEISLIAPRDLIDPRANAASKVFGSDIYSARYPRVNFKIKWSAIKALQERLAPLGKLANDERFHVDADRMESDPIRELEENPAVQAEFLIERGMEPNYGENKHVSQRKMQQQIGEAGLTDEFNDHVERVLASLEPIERLFKGHTDRGARYIPHTIENVLREMTRSLRDAEGFNYGVGSIRSKVSQQFKSISALKKADHQIVSKADFAKVKEEVNNEFVELANEAQGYSSNKGFGFLDAFSEHLKEIAEGMSPGRVLREYYDDAPPELGVKMADFLNKLRNMPTEYFEAKIKRAVTLDEFAGAVVPDDASPRTLKILADNGITDIKVYKRNDPADRARAVREFQETQFFQKARGSITFADGASIIRLFEGRDLSTLAHESGHLWLAELEFDVKRVGAGEQAKADWQTVLDFVGSTDGYITREQHELFARAFETYLMEGKAPSEGLRSVFRQFKNWLISIYRNLAKLQAPISPEMRQVFDRLLATDEEIAGAQNAQAFNPVFTDAKSAEMTEAEFQAYTKRVTQVVDEAEQRVLEKVMASIRKQRTKEVAAEKAKIRGEVKDELMAEPGQAALHFLRNGVMFAGETPEILKGRKLSRDGLIALVGQEGLSALPMGIYAEEGIDPAELAQVFGLGNGLELVERLMQIQAEQLAMRAKGDGRSVINARIAEETQRRLTESLGDPLNDGSIEAEAMAAVHSDKQGALMASELKVLARKAGHSGAISLDDIKAWAANAIGEMSSYQSTQFAKYQRAERMSGQKVQRALVKGDFMAAFRAKQDQLVNFALYQEAKKAADDADSIRKRMDRYASAAQIKSMDQGALNAIHEILEEYDFKKRSGTLLAERTLFNAFAEQQKELGIEVLEPPRLKGARDKHFSQMTMDELRGLSDTVEQMAKLGRLKKELLDGQKKRDFEAVVAEGMATAADRPQRGVSRDDTGLTTFQERMGRLVSGIKSGDSSLIKLETLFEWLDGDKTGRGIFTRLGFKPFADAQGRERDRLVDLQSKLKALYALVPDEQRAKWLEVHDIQALPKPGGRAGKFNKTQLIAMALNIGNQSSLEKLTAGMKWDEQAVRTTLDKYLTREEWQFVQNVWDLIDTQWPELKAVHERVTGLAPPKIEPIEVPTPFGPLKGGYYPAVYDPNLSTKAAKIGAKADVAATVGEIFPGGAFRPSTRAGATHARTGFEAPIRLSLDVIVQHLTDVAHDIEFREAILNAHKFFSDDRIKQAIIDAVGPEYEEQIDPWLKNIAHEWVIDRQGLNAVQKFANTLRTNVVIVGLGFRISTMLAQTAGYSNSVQRLGVVRMADGMRAFAKAPIQQFEFVHGKSAEMRHRANDLERDLRAAQLKMQGKTGFLNDVRRFAFKGIAWADAAVSIPTWIGAYNQGLAEHKMTDEQAVYYADKMVRDTQGSGAAKDMAAIQRGGPLLKLFTMFYSYFNVFYNRQRSLARDVRDPGVSWGSVVAQTFWLLVLPSLLSPLLTGQGPGDDEEWAEWAARNVFFGLFTGLPYIRDAANSANNKVAGKAFGEARLSPIEGFIPNVIHLGKDIIKMASGEEASKGAIKNLFNVAGVVTALPLGQPGSTAQYVWDVLIEGSENPENLLEWLRGLTIGPEHKR